MNTRLLLYTNSTKPKKSPRQSISRAQHFALTTVKCYEKNTNEIDSYRAHAHEKTFHENCFQVIPEYGGRQSVPVPSGLVLGRSRSSPSPPTTLTSLISVNQHICINEKKDFGLLTHQILIVIVVRIVNDTHTITLIVATQTTSSKTIAVYR